jgi:hypothetical protein
VCELQEDDTWLDCELTAFWYVAVATGNRPLHIYEMRGVTVLADGLNIRWSGRKVGGTRRAAQFYPFRWSGPPAEHVNKILQGFNGRYRRSQRRPNQTGWRIHGTHEEWPSADTVPGPHHNPASTLYAWLRRRATAGSESWTATTGRDTMATHVLPLVGQDPDVMTGEMYFVLFDQHEHTARSHYLSGR